MIGIDTLRLLLVNIVGRPIAALSKINRLLLSPPTRIRLVYLPPYSPEPQPAETLWALLDEPIVNRHIATIEQLEEKIANQCIALAEQPDKIQKRTGFHWWPKRISPNESAGNCVTAPDRSARAFIKTVAKRGRVHI